MWERLVGNREDGPPLSGLWWQTQTSLAADIHLAAEQFHWPIDEYYRRTTWKIRLLNRIAFGYRREQEQEAEDHAERQRDTDEAMRHQGQQMYGRQ